MNTQSHPDPEDFEDPLSNYEPKVYPSEVEQALAEGTVSELQTTPYAEIAADSTVRHAVQALFGLRVANLLVVDKGQLVGVFTERDVLERVAESYAKYEDQPISEVMTPNPVVVYDDDPPAAALAAISAGGYRHVPVLQRGGKPIGVVSPRRMFEFLEAKFQPSNGS